MLFDASLEFRRYRRGPFERLRIALAHLVYRRIALLGDRSAALAAMGVFYSRTSGPHEGIPADLDAAVDTLTTTRDPVTDERSESARHAEDRQRLLLAALRVGYDVVRLTREAPGARRDVADALRRLDDGVLDERLIALLSETRPRLADAHVPTEEIRAVKPPYRCATARPGGGRGNPRPDG